MTWISDPAGIIKKNKKRDWQGHGKNLSFCMDEQLSKRWPKIVTKLVKGYTYYKVFLYGWLWLLCTFVLE